VRTATLVEAEASWTSPRQNPIFMLLQHRAV
jgi:hypothetical protein